MAALSALYPTLLDLAKRTDPKGQIAKIVEILDQKNEFLQYLPFAQANDVASHTTTVRTGLPPVVWTKIGSGVKSGKSNTIQVSEGIGMLEAYGEVDDRLVSLASDKAAFRLSEEKPQIESFSQEIARAFLFENVSVNPERFTGLAARYGTLSTGTAACAENVIAGGGSGTDNTSIWLLGLGEETISGLVPKGSEAGLKITDKGLVTAENWDGDQGRAEIWRTHYIQKLGLTVRDWRYGVRICNIDKSALTPDASGGANLPRLMFQAMNRIYSLSGVQPLWLMSRDTMTTLGQQASDGTKGSTLKTEEVGGKFINTWHGIPIARVDALAADEALVS